ncbi:peptidase M3, partial [Parasutterella sp.]
MTSSLKNKMPAWDFRSSYGSLSSPAYRKACQRLEADIHILAGLVPNAKDSVSIAIALEHLAEVFCLTDSLIGYCRCLSAIDTREQEAAKERVRLWEIHSRYYELITELFHRLAGLKKSDPIWKELDFSKWEWLFERVSTRWSFSLSPRTLQLLYELKASNFVPCADLYHSLNAHLVATVRTMDGLTKHQSHSQCIAVLKTSEDPKLRQSTFTALNEYYSQNAYLYASIFNMLTGFRLKGFEFAEMDFMAPAYWQNAVSSEAVDALMTAVRANRHMLRKSVISRALFTGKSVMEVWDLNAPAPLRREIHIPYEEALEKIKEVGKVLDERIPETFDLFVEKGWVEVRQLPGKQNGAFFQGILSLNEPRIFSTYLGSFASMSQQAIMYGHAWHFWLQRGLPAQERKIPRALMEVVGHFFALLLFEEIQAKAASAEEKLEALWQELSFISNYVIN